MARLRQIKPGFFTDDRVGNLSRDARLLFLGLLSEADDEGRLVDAPKRIAGVVFAYDDDATPALVEQWITELTHQRMVLRYSHEGGRYLWIRKFREHQKMSHPTPSTLPPPPAEDEGAGQEAWGSDSGAPPEILRSDSGAPPEDFAPEVVLEGVGVAPQPAPRSAPKGAPKRATSAPDTFEVSDALRSWLAEHFPSHTDERWVQSETERFLDHHRAKGSLFKDWSAAWRQWMRRAVEYGARAPKSNSPPALTALDEWRRRAEAAMA